MNLNQSRYKIDIIIPTFSNAIAARSYDEPGRQQYRWLRYGSWRSVRLSPRRSDSRDALGTGAQGRARDGGRYQARRYVHGDRAVRYTSSNGTDQQQAVQPVRSDRYGEPYVRNRRAFRRIGRVRDRVPVHRAAAREWQLHSAYGGCDRCEYPFQGDF